MLLSPSIRLIVMLLWEQCISCGSTMRTDKTARLELRSRFALIQDRSIDPEIVFVQDGKHFIPNNLIVLGSVEPLW
jgi:hypothetical protein